MLWLVDRQSGGNFNDLGSSDSFVLDPGSVLAVGELFGNYEIVAYQASKGSGLIGSGLSLQTEDDPIDADGAISAGDHLALVWFPTLDYDPAGSTLISETDNGVEFGFLTGSGSGAWQLPASTATITYHKTPGAAEFQQFSNRSPGQLLEVVDALTDSYQDWMTVNFPDPADQSDLLISGPGADPDGSGLSNLMRYALNLSRGESPVGKLPYMLSESGVMHFAMPFDPNKTDLLLIGEAGEDLVSWPHQIFDSTSTTLDPVEGWLKIPTDDIVTEGQSLFFRLRVEQR